MSLLVLAREVRGNILNHCTELSIYMKELTFLHGLTNHTFFTNWSVYCLKKGTVLFMLTFYPNPIELFSKLSEKDVHCYIFSNNPQWRERFQHLDSGFRIFVSLPLPPPHSTSTADHQTRIKLSIQKLFAGHSFAEQKIPLQSNQNMSKIFTKLYIIHIMNVSHNSNIPDRTHHRIEQEVQYHHLRGPLDPSSYHLGTSRCPSISSLVEVCPLSSQNPRAPSVYFAACLQLSCHY